jgi:hypothetical protein
LAHWPWWLAIPGLISAPIGIAFMGAPSDKED